MADHNVVAIIPAAGRGTRVGGELTKQYRPHRGKPLLRHTLSRIESSPAVEAIILVVHPEDRALCRDRVLGEGEVVLTAMDGTGGGKEIGRRLARQVLGQTMSVPVGSIFLALRSGAALLPLVTYWSEEGAALYRSEIGPEFDLNRDLPLDQALEQGADLMANCLERYLQDHPADWHFWEEFRPGRFLENSEEESQ